MTTRLGVRAALVEGRLVPGDVTVVDGRIASFGHSPARGGAIAVPGLVDVQLNGFAGLDFLTAEAGDYAAASAALAASGVTAYLPTFITAPGGDLLRATAAAHEAAAAAAGQTGARVLGVHLEGPFLAPAYRGIHPDSALRAPDIGFTRQLLEAGTVSMVTLAPELPGALEVIEFLTRRGVVVSCGHTAATAAEADIAFAAGARAVTHLFNAMRPLHHRDPGIAGAALAHDHVFVGLIVDHYHLAPQTAAIVWRAARERLCLVTDGIAAAGVGDGDYRVGPAEVQVRDGRARLADGTLAGNVETLLEGVRKLHALGATLEEALGAATAVPARLLGRDDVGVLRPGARADVLVLDERLEVARVLVGGRDAIPD